MTMRAAFPVTRGEGTGSPWILPRAFLLGHILLFPGVSGQGQLAAQTNPVTLDTLRVQVGSRARSRVPALTRSIRILGADEIGKLPARTLGGLLEWATGVEVQSRSPAQSDLSIRGAGSEQVLVLVNGVRMSDPQTGHFDLDLAVPLDQVERVEILRGPASALYGADAVGGVVNVVTKGVGAGWTGRIEGGSWGSARAGGGGGWSWGESGSVQFGGEWSRSDGHRAGTDFETVLLHAALSRPMGAGGWMGDFGLARRDFGAQDFYAPYPSFEKTRTYTSALRWRSGADAGVGVEVGTSFRRHEDEFTLVRENPAVYQNRHTSSQVGVDALARSTPRDGLDAVLGGELYQDMLRSNALGDRDEARGALFGELALGGNGNGTLSFGARQDWHESFGSFLSPSLSGSVRFSPFMRARAAVGRSFRAPTWTERYYRDPINVGREDLDPERTWSGEMGLDVSGRSDFRLAVTAFSRRGEDLIDWARPSEADPAVPWETRNVKEADFLGLETELELRGPFGLRWRVGGMLLSVDSKESLGYLSKYVLRPVTEQTTLGVSKNFQGGVDMGLNLQRARRDGEDPYYRLDIRGGFRLGPAWVYLDANNLFDARYPDITGALAPGRALYLGIEWGGSRKGG